MVSRSKLSIPPKLMLIDVIGTILFGLGIAKQVAGIDYLPDHLRFAGSGIVFIVAGCALMMPAIFFIIGAARTRKETLSGRKK